MRSPPTKPAGQIVLKQGRRMRSQLVLAERARIDRLPRMSEGTTPALSHHLLICWIVYDLENLSTCFTTTVNGVDSMLRTIPCPYSRLELKPIPNFATVTE